MDGRQQMSGHVTIFGHVISAGVVVSSLSGLLPPLSALVAIIWYAISIWETETVKGWRTSFAKWRQRRSGDTAQKG